MLEREEGPSRRRDAGGDWRRWWWKHEAGRHPVLGWWSERRGKPKREGGARVRGGAAVGHHEVATIWRNASETPAARLSVSV